MPRPSTAQLQIDATVQCTMQRGSARNSAQPEILESGHAAAVRARCSIRGSARCKGVSLPALVCCAGRGIAEAVLPLPGSDAGVRAPWRALAAGSCCGLLLRALAAGSCCGHLLQALAAGSCCGLLLRALAAASIAAHAGPPADLWPTLWLPLRSPPAAHMLTSAPLAIRSQPSHPSGASECRGCTLEPPGRAYSTSARPPGSSSTTTALWCLTRHVIPNHSTPRHNTTRHTTMYTMPDCPPRFPPCVEC